MRFVSWAKEDDVRFYDRVTDESQSNSVSQSTPPPSASPSEANLQGELCHSTLSFAALQYLLISDAEKMAAPGILEDTNFALFRSGAASALVVDLDKGSESRLGLRLV